MIITTDSHNCDDGSANNKNYNNKHQHITNPIDLKVGLEILKSLTAYLLEYTQYQFLHHENSRQTSIPTTASATTDSRRISVLSGGDVHVLLFVCPHHLSYAEEMGIMMMMMIMIVMMMIMMMMMIVMMMMMMIAMMMMMMIMMRLMIVWMMMMMMKMMMKIVVMMMNNVSNQQSHSITHLHSRAPI